MEVYITLNDLVQVGVFLCAYTTLLLAIGTFFGKKK